MEKNNKDNHKEFKIFIILFIIASLFLLNEKNQNKLMKIFKSIDQKETVLELVDSFKNDGDILDINIYDDTIINWKDNKLSFKELDGTIIVEKEFNFVDPFIYYGEKNVYVMDKATGDIYSFDKKGQTVNKIQLNKEVFSLKESDQNLIYHTKLENGESINVLNKEGVQLGNYSYENRNILTYSTNKNGTKNAIASLQINNGIIQNQIDCYGKNNKKLYEVDIVGEIVVYLGFTSKDDIVALTDNSLYFIKDDKIVWEKKFELIKDIYIGNEKINILYSNYLETMDYDGNIERKVGFGEDYKKMLPFEKNILLYGDDNITIVEGDSQILKHEDGIIDAYVSKGKILTWGREEIKIYIVGTKK